MKTNATLSLLHQYHKAAEGTKKQAFGWFIEQAQMTPCKALDDLPPEVQYIVEDALDAAPPKKNMCHDNAWRLAMADERIEVHNGWACSSFPTEHSWCSVLHEGERHYFDPTDLALFNGTHFSDHVSFAKLNKNQLLLRAHTHEHTGPYHQHLASEALELQPSELNGSELQTLPALQVQKLAARALKASSSPAPARKSKASSKP